MKNGEQVELQVLKKITPKQEERNAVEKIVQNTLNSLKLKIDLDYPDLETRVDGSYAKDTWVSGEADVDIFIRIPPDKQRSFLEEECLNLIKGALHGNKILERYAEHPYVEALVDDIRVNVVPCYRTEPGKWLSATDRTPFHTDYMKSRLTEDLKGQVRLLKKFMKGNEIYGAEVKVKGFSGFLCEVLTLKHGSFKETLQAASNWKRPQLIDVEGSYKGKEDDALNLFDSPLIVVDPIDKARNVASAVSEENMWRFVQASRTHLASPNIKHFYPEAEAIGFNQVKKAVSNRRENVVLIDLGVIDAIVDVLWSQLYKTEKALINLLKSFDFKTLRSKPWSRENGHSFIFLEFDERILSPLKKHYGPPVQLRKSSESFLQKHLKSPDTVTGPWIEEDRWSIIRTRRYLDAVELIKAKLSNGGEDLGAPSRIAESLRMGFEVIGADEALTRYSQDNDFLQFFFSFLKDRPVWLESNGYD